jgi:hypothetical protein
MERLVKYLETAANAIIVITAVLALAYKVYHHFAQKRGQ